MCNEALLTFLQTRPTTPERFFPEFPNVGSCQSSFGEHAQLATSVSAAETTGQQGENNKLMKFLSRPKAGCQNFNFSNISYCFDSPGP